MRPLLIPTLQEAVEQRVKLRSIIIVLAQGARWILLFRISKNGNIQLSKNTDLTTPI
jgi:hypothetical protein